ncbi:MAG: carboxypeptidase regulatory-like domain-containing protein [Theionarchaea archaeon]|nr:carboxypeptidase regulatory-like domain-containing protein [Theionarchaea archaeon]
MTQNIKKIIPKDPKSIIVALIFLGLIGYMACPLSISLEPVDWWTNYDMLWWSDNFTTDRFLTESDVAENVGLLASSSSGSGILGLHAYGTGQMYGKLIYTFTTDWIIEKGRLGVIANSDSKTCAVDVFIDNQLAGSFNGGKEILFCTSEYLPTSDDSRQWIVCQDPHKVQVKLIFYSLNANGPKDLILSLMEFSARVHPLAPDEEEEGKGSLVGHVINSQTNAKIPSATIALGNHSTQSDSQGYYEINNIKPGTYTVKVTKSGYKEATNTVTISECETAGCNQFDAYLTPLNSVTATSDTTLEGYVTKNGNPISDAQVLLMLQLSEMYKAKTDSKGYYKITGIESRTYSIKILAKNCAPHDNTVDLIGENRYDAQMGDGVSYPILPGRGFTEQDGETNYNYYPPTPPDYPTYVPRIRESAGNNYPLQGPVYQNPTLPAPSDGADYVPPPPGYQNSGSVAGSGVSLPPSGGLVGTIERSVRGWQTIFQNIGRLIRRLS